jgi:hypothetical protein
MNRFQQKQKLPWWPLLVFAVSMGILEAILVVYIRELFYPDGFAFPLHPVPNWLAGVEILREVATLLMIGAVAWISGKSFLQRLSGFLFIFGVWDIVYYVGLKLILGWPESLLTWDILFLIPVAWTGPVLAPLICSAVMIFMAAIFEKSHSKGKVKSLKPAELLLIFAGEFIIFITFIYDTGKIIMEGNYVSELFTPKQNEMLLNEIYTFIPQNYMWGVFAFGLALIISGVILFSRREFQAI